MNRPHLQVVPNPYDDLPPKTRGELHAVDEAYAKTLGDVAPELAPTTEAAKAAYAAINTAHKLFRDAASDLVVFTRAAGAQVERLSIWSRGAIALALIAITLGEIALGFPGLRYALGHHGEIDSPLEDPLALVATTAFGLLSLKLAGATAREWMGAGRGVLHDPVPGVLSSASGSLQVLLDGDGRQLLPESPLATTTGASAASTPAAASEGDDGLTTRFEHVLHDDVRRRSRLRRAGVLAAVGIALWSANGYMRSQYVSAVGSRPVVTTVTGIGVTPTASSRPDTHDPVLELVLVGLGILFFVGMILVSTRGESALAQRERALQLHREARLRELEQTVARAADALRAFERQRAAIEYAQAKADSDRGIATAAGVRS